MPFLLSLGRVTVAKVPKYVKDPITECLAGIINAKIIDSLIFECLMFGLVCYKMYVHNMAGIHTPVLSTLYFDGQYWFIHELVCGVLIESSIGLVYFGVNASKSCRNLLPFCSGSTHRLLFSAASLFSIFVWYVLPLCRFEKCQLTSSSSGL